jgi:5-hydroxyisourate hydrolase
MSLSTHVLDAARGRPARGVPVRLERRDGDAWERVAEARTDDDGRVRDLPPPGMGVHRLVFDTAGLSDFYPEVAVAFTVTDPGEHYHVPLLLSPYAYSTYRGS